MKLKNFYHSILRKFTKLSEKTIHVEAFVREDLWDIVKNLIGKKYIWFVITPANFDYCKVFFNLKMSKNEFTEILKKRIEYLKKNGEEIQLHLHICNVKEFFDNELQDNLFKEAMDFMILNKINPTKLAPGWFKYDDYTISLAKKCNIKYLYDYNKNPRQKPIIKDGVTIKFLHKFWHDYDFIKK